MRHSALVVGALALAAVTACSSASSTGSPRTTRPASSITPSATSTDDSADDAGATSTGSPSSAAASVAGSGTASGGPPRGVPGDAPGSSQVAAAVRAFYARYLADPAGEDVKGFLTTAAAQRLLTPGVDADPVLCAQNTPVSLSFGVPVVRDALATVAVTTHWSGGSTAGPITVTVALPDILISAITCPTG